MGTTLRSIIVCLMLLAASPLLAQSWPENHGFVQYTDDPERIDIQGQIVVPHNADFVELQTARLLHRYFRDYVIIPEPAHSDSLYSFFNPGYGNLRPTIFVGKTRLADKCLTRKDEIRDEKYAMMVSY